MPPLSDQIDQFVRWFFNVSPTAMSIEPQDEPQDVEISVHPVVRGQFKSSPPTAIEKCGASRLR